MKKTIHLKKNKNTLNINDETYILTTNNIGMFNHTSTTNTMGLNYVNITYNGNYYYNGTGINKTFTVSKKKHNSNNKHKQPKICRKI